MPGKSNTNDRHKGQTVGNVITQTVGDYLVVVPVWSKSMVKLKSSIEADGKKPPADVEKCLDRHVVRTPQGVVVVEVMARAKVFSRSIPFSKVRETAKESLDAALAEGNTYLDDEQYRMGLDAIAGRLARKLRKYGVTVAVI